MLVLQVNGRNVVTPKPETEEYNVQSFIYTRHRPFQPRRLFALLYDKFILQMEHPAEDDEEDDEEDAMDQDGKESALPSKAAGGQVEDVDMDGQDEVQGSSIAGSEERRNSSSEHSEKSAASTAQTVPSLHGDAPHKAANGNAAAAGMDVDEDQEEDDDEDPLDIPPNDVILANKRAHPTFKRLFRSKGEFYLATRPHRAGDWSQAGAMLTLTGGRPWFCTLPAEEYMTGDAEVDSLVQHDIKKGGEWGDRRQELVFIGEKLDHVHLEKLLDHCLLTDEEMIKWEKVMRDDKLNDEARIDAMQEVFDDGFPDWVDEDEQEEEEEDGMEEDAKGKGRAQGHEGHNHSHGGSGGKHSVMMAKQQQKASAA